jgi:hypothetical protein
MKECMLAAHSMEAACCATYLGQKGIEPQNQLNVAVEQHLDLVNDSFSINPASNNCL